MIQKQGNRFIVLTRDGKKVLGVHGTRFDAEVQEVTIVTNVKPEVQKDGKTKS